MSAVAADRSLQYLSALERANQVRLARASMKRHIRTADNLEESRERAVRVILDPPDAMAGFEVHALLCTIVRFGAGRASKMCGQLRLRETKPLGQLTERQRHELAEHLRANFPVKPKPPVLFEEAIA
jgi:hypothetical protein